jgi:hypothetical protein
MLKQDLLFTQSFKLKVEESDNKRSHIPPPLHHKWILRTRNPKERRTGYGVLYKFCAMPLGIASVPRIYNVVMSATIVHLQQMGICIAFFVDNLIKDKMQG